MVSDLCFHQKLVLSWTIIPDHPLWTSRSSYASHLHPMDGESISKIGADKQISKQTKREREREDNFKQFQTDRQKKV